MIQLSYTQLGKGSRKVMVLHGWFGDQTFFNTLENILDLETYTYVIPSYRGYGGSKHLTGNYDMAEISADVLALADRLGWDTFSLVGHSMGGMAAQRVLADAPGRVEKIIALTPVPASGTPLDEDGQALFGGAAENIDNRQAIIAFTTGNRLTETWVQQMAQYSVETSTKVAFHGYMNAWTKTDFHQEIKGNTVSMKVIVGAHDPALSAEVMNATYMQWYPNATLEVMDNAGHYPVSETPIAFVTVMEAFLGP